ncbi:hypothetical protein [Methylomagnum ishizawai]|uniref:hypothetical protein n=1 Tax=Methylomagnum ishizawai TaxID=1760988 RepID=UPI001594E4EF|nr:hypothetical protein [Methylomagnum ishizawai]
MRQKDAGQFAAPSPAKNNAFILRKFFYFSFKNKYLFMIKVAMPGLDPFSDNLS